jgi:hypothetical protein
VGGVAAVSIAAGVGAPWMLGTNSLDASQRALVSITRPCLARMLNVFPELRNWVHAANTTSVRWLTRIGFRVEPARPYGLAGEMFHPFGMRA